MTIQVTNVYELLSTLTGPDSVSAYPENDAIRVASYAASSPEDRDGTTWSVSGADSAQFSIEDGALRFHIDSVNPDLFVLPPDFESPADSDMDNVYEVTVKATADSTGQSLSQSVSVTVINQEEAGTVTLSPAHPSVGTVLTAALSDPDGVVAGTETWAWERLVGPREWVTIASASSASYTPVAADADHYLRATASYTDGHGAGKSAQGRAGNPESTDRSLTGRAAGLAERSAGVAAFAGRCRGRTGARSRRSARLGGAEGAGARVREACAGMLARGLEPGRRCERASGGER